MASKRVRVVNKLPEFIEQRQRLAVVQAMNLLPIELVTLAGDQLVTDSLRVARHFGRRHDDVLKAVRRLDCSGDFRLRNFAETVTHRSNPSGGSDWQSRPSTRRSSWGHLRPLDQGKPQGNFWGPGGEPNFLRQGFANAEPNIRATIAKRLKASGR